MPRLRGKPKTKEGFALTIQGGDGLMKFLDKFPERIDDFMSTAVKKLAGKIVKTEGDGVDFSMKGRDNAWIPRDTGRLMAVFGGFEGKAQQGYIRDKTRAAAKSPKPYDADVIWEEIGKFTIVFGTDLYYASFVQHRTDFMGTYLRAKESDFTAYLQRIFDTEVRSIVKAYGFEK